jgi:hypothetical protein
MLKFYFAVVVCLLCLGCAAPPKYHGRFSGTIHPIVLEDVTGGKFTGMMLEIDSSEIDKIESSLKPHFTFIGSHQILVNSSRVCYQPSDFKSNRVVVKGWIMCSVKKSPLSHKEIRDQQNGQNCNGALVVRRWHISYPKSTQ